MKHSEEHETYTVRGVAYGLEYDQEVCEECDWQGEPS